MNALFRQLKKDHKEVKELLHEIEESTPRAAKKRQELISEVKQKLIPHARAEEKILYGKMKSQDRDLEVSALEGYQEHKLADELLSEILELDPTSALWQAKFLVFKENLEHHIKEEENHFFKQCEEDMSADYDRMLEDFTSLKEQLMESLPTQREYGMTPEEVVANR